MYWRVGVGWRSSWGWGESGCFVIDVCEVFNFESRFGDGCSNSCSSSSNFGNCYSVECSSSLGWDCGGCIIIDVGCKVFDVLSSFFCLDLYEIFDFFGVVWMIEF